MRQHLLFYLNALAMEALGFLSLCKQPFALGNLF